MKELPYGVLVDPDLPLGRVISVTEEADGRSVVSVLDPNVMARISPFAELKEVARLARQKLERALDEPSR